MQCPNCALYHPARYERCVSCGTNLVPDGGDLVAQAAPVATQHSRGRHQEATTDNAREAIGAPPPSAPRRGMPTGLGVAIAAFILLASAGGTFFFLTKSPESERLLREGQKQLADGQYAFALKTLQDASRAKPNDPRVLLALARAYVGVDQVDKAWDCITQAQQLGAGVVTDPSLASDLANYYRQHNQYGRAVELLRPLAANNAAGKKAELADLDASWGDDCLRDGDYKQAMKCWEEVRDLHDGSRYTEAETRLSTIYQKIGDEMFSKGDDEEALKYYTKLNVLAPTGASYERTADLYQKQGKLELAIDQMRKAVKASGDPAFSNRKLAALMVQRGKELLDSGDADAGYGYLQQAQALDNHVKAPPATVRNAHLDVMPGGFVHFTGEVWNPGPDPLSAMTVRAEVFDNKTATSIWSRDQRIIDEFVPPLPARESRPFDLTTNVATPDINTAELRIFLNGVLYKTYPVNGKVSAADRVLNKSAGESSPRPPALKPRLTPPTPTTTSDTMPSPAPNVVQPDGNTPPVAPDTVPGQSPEEKTLKDLD